MDLRPIYTKPSQPYPLPVRNIIISYAISAVTLSMAACSSIASSPLHATKASNLLSSTYNLSTTTHFRLSPFHLLLKPLKLASHHHLPQSRRYLAAGSSENLQVLEDDGSAVETEEEGSSGKIPDDPSGAAGRLFVGNLPLTVTSEELTEIFAEAGRVSDAEIIYNRKTDTSRGFGYVSMATVEEAYEAIKMFNDSKFGGQRVKVQFSKIPRASNTKILGLKVWDKCERFIDSPHKILAGNLDWGVTSAALKQAFAGQPGLISAKVCYGRETKKSRGFAIVSFKTAEDVEAAIYNMHGVELLGRRLHCKAIKPPKSTGSESSPVTGSDSSKLVSSINS